MKKTLQHKLHIFFRIVGKFFSKDRSSKLFHVVLLVAVFSGGFFLASYFENSHRCFQAADRLTCEREELVQIFKEKGAGAAYDLFSLFYENDPSFSGECHAMGHELGYAAYELFRAGQLDSAFADSRIAYCDYGFFHGFVYAFVWDRGSNRVVQGLCQELQSLITDGRLFINACMHGIGHGFTDGNDPRLWGDVDATVEASLTVCRELATSPGDTHNCAAGVFHQLSKLTRDPKYSFPFNDADPYDLCRKQTDPEVRKGCYGGRSPLVYIRLARQNILDVLPYLEDIDPKEAANAMQTLVAMELERAGGISGPAVVARLCYRADPRLHEACIRGVAAGTVSLYPDTDYSLGMQFCTSDTVHSSEKAACYRQLFERSQLEHTLTEHRRFCLRVPATFRDTCTSYKQPVSYNLPQSLDEQRFFAIFPGLFFTGEPFSTLVETLPSSIWYDAFIERKKISGALIQHATETNDY